MGKGETLKRVMSKIGNKLGRGVDAAEDFIKGKKRSVMGGDATVREGGMIGNGGALATVKHKAGMNKKKLAAAAGATALATGAVLASDDDDKKKKKKKPEYLED